MSSTELYAVAGASFVVVVVVVVDGVKRLLSDPDRDWQHLRMSSLGVSIQLCDTRKVAEEIAECQRVLEKSGLKYHVSKYNMS